MKQAQIYTGISALQWMFYFCNYSSLCPTDWKIFYIKFLISILKYSKNKTVEKQTDTGVAREIISRMKTRSWRKTYAVSYPQIGTQTIVFSSQLYSSDSIEISMHCHFNFQVCQFNVFLLIFKLCDPINCHQSWKNRFCQTKKGLA